MRIPLLLVLLGAIAPTEATAQSDVSWQDRAAFAMRCLRETASNPDAPSDLDTQVCQTAWSEARAALPLADAVIALSPRGRNGPTLANARAAFPAIAWQQPSQDLLDTLPTVLLEGRFEPGKIILHGTARSVAGISLEFTEPNGMNSLTLPDLDAALRVRGATSATIACVDFSDEVLVDYGETSYMVRRIDIPRGRSITLVEQSANLRAGGAIFALAVYLTAPVPTLADLQAGRLGAIIPEGFEQFWTSCEE